MKLRFKTKRQIDRHPFFIVDEGKIGTLEHIDKNSIALKMDDHIDDCEEWDNCIVWSDFESESISEFLNDCELIEVESQYVKEFLEYFGSLDDFIEAEILLWLLTNEFEDQSWHNDVAPSFLDNNGYYQIYVHPKNKNKREHIGVSRFIVCGPMDDDYEVYHECETLDELKTWYYENPSI